MNRIYHAGGCSGDPVDVINGNQALALPDRELNLRSAVYIGRKAQTVPHFEAKILRVGLYSRITDRFREPTCSEFPNKGTLFNYQELTLVLGKEKANFFVFSFFFHKYVVQFR